MIYKFSDFSPYVEDYHFLSKKGLKFYDIAHKVFAGIANKSEIKFAKMYSKKYLQKYASSKRLFSS